MKIRIRKPFNSRPHEEVDENSSTGRETFPIFQFTTSRRGRRFRSRARRKSLYFQFTTSRRGRPSLSVVGGTWGPFNSRPHEEVDFACPFCVSSPSFFQFTTSRRGRRLPENTPSAICFFQFTTSRRGRRSRTCLH